MRRNILFYIVTLLIFGGGIFLTIRAGKRLEQERVSAPVSSAMSKVVSSLIAAVDPQGRPSRAMQVIRENLRQPISLLLVQLILIVILARVFGAIFTRLGQPSVIGEMVAGIVLGPSVLGALWPGFSQTVFPAESLGTLRMLSQVGIILFMFVVGMELDLKHLRGKADTAIMVSQISIILPFFLGVLFSFFIFQTYAAANASFLAFALFMGIAMSITAFPVLARILEDRNMTRSYLGITALTCAAIGDVTAWSLLAFVVAIVKAGDAGQGLMTILLAAVFIVAMFLLIKPMLERALAGVLRANGDPGRGATVGILVLVFSAALFTEVVGIHALFGAFLVGVVMPRDAQFHSRLKDRLENFSSAFLLPLFFAFTGLRTQVGLLADWNGWMVCAVLIAAATVGKLGGAMVTARWTGLGWNDSFALGALMNTRGLVELIVLNVGFDLGILSARVFAMTVIMALVTTFMTGPLLSLSVALRRKKSAMTAPQPTVYQG